MCVCVCVCEVNLANVILPLYLPPVFTYCLLGYGHIHVCVCVYDIDLSFEDLMVSLFIQLENLPQRKTCICLNNELVEYYFSPLVII